MKSFQKNLKALTTRNHHPREQEKGIALVLTLMMGFLLISGASALLVRKLVERKIGAYTSYQQMAENAAVSGFNHILGQLNNPIRSKYKGYLYSVDNIPGSDTEWANINDQNSTSGIELEEICTPTIGSYAIPEHPDNNKSWPIDLVPLDRSEKPSTLRDDGSEPVIASYRLRSYDKNFSDNKASGVFSIEGLITRNDKVLARTLLTRSLDIKFVVADTKDWAIINAAEFDNLNNVRINGEGIITINADVLWNNNCDQSALEGEIGNSVSGSTSPLIWPVRQRGIPGPVLYEQNRANDIVNGYQRVWSFDDSGSLNRGTQCTEIVCTRDETWNSYEDYVNASATESIESNSESSKIVIKASHICKDTPSSSPCHLNIEYLNLSKTKIYIENSERPVVIHLLSPSVTSPNPSAISTGSIILKDNAVLCGVNVQPQYTSIDLIECNQKPERFVITNGKDEGDFYNRCNAEQGVLEIGGNSLPAAWVGLQSGTISLNGNTTMRGVLWAQSICGDGHNLTIETSTIINEAEDVWNWKKDNLWGGNGRQTIRGIRGAGMDLFEKF